MVMHSLVSSAGFFHALAWARKNCLVAIATFFNTVKIVAEPIKTVDVYNTTQDLLLRTLTGEFLCACPQNLAIVTRRLFPSPC